MDYEQLQQYQQSLLDRALTEGIRRNDEQTQTWSEYKARHEKVIESLEYFSQELSVECMVPIGKKALMRGKLAHTNEILVSLGEGYFAKYSASQAVALCHRRIKGANDILEGLTKERDLYEMRQRIPECFDAFGSDERKDLIEHWEDEKLNDWRVEHREREKEYKKKLAELKNTEKQEIKTEEDLFEKLDALELQEELEAELDRLEAKLPDFYTQDLAEGEVYEETDASTDETEDETEEDENINEAKIDRMEIQSSREESNSAPVNGSKIDVSPPDDESIFPDAQLVAENRKKILFNDSNSKFANFTDSSTTKQPLSDEASPVEKKKLAEICEKRVIFGEPVVKYFSEEQRICATNVRDDLLVRSSANDSSDEDIVRIEFEHSVNEPEIFDSGDSESFTSPRDIYKIHSKPKSILKNSGQSRICEFANSLSVDDNDSGDETINDDGQSGISAYSTIVKDIREYVSDKTMSRSIEPTEEKRTVSKFKRDRASMKK